MAGKKRLRSVIQSIAHHSISGLCYLHPHLGEQCKNDKIESISFNLTNGIFTLNLSKMSPELKLSSEALIERFDEILQIENIDRNNIKKAVTTFKFDHNQWARYCYAKVVTIEGEELCASVSSMGEVGKVIEKYS